MTSLRCLFFHYFPTFFLWRNYSLLSKSIAADLIDLNSLSILSKFLKMVIWDIDSMVLISILLVSDLAGLSDLLLIFQISQWCSWFMLLVRLLFGAYYYCYINVSVISNLFHLFFLVCFFFLRNKTLIIHDDFRFWMHSKYPLFSILVDNIEKNTLILK